MNEIRGQNLMKKMKDYEAQGKMVLVTPGASHVPALESNFPKQLPKKIEETEDKILEVLDDEDDLDELEEELEDYIEEEEEDEEEEEEEEKPKKKKDKAKDFAKKMKGNPAFGNVPPELMIQYAQYLMDYHTGTIPSEDSGKGKKKIKDTEDKKKKKKVKEESKTKPKKE